MATQIARRISLTSDSGGSMKLDMYLPSNILPYDFYNLHNSATVTHSSSPNSRLSTTDPAVTCVRFDFNNSNSTPGYDATC